MTDDEIFEECAKFARVFQIGRTQLTNAEIIALIGVGAENGGTAFEVSKSVGGAESSINASKGTHYGLIKKGALIKGKKKHGLTRINIFELSDQAKRTLHILFTGKDREKTTKQ